MENKPQKNNLAKYGGLAFQLLAYLLVGYFIGKFIDDKLGNTTPYGIAGTCTLFLSIGIYSVIRDVLHS